MSDQPERRVMRGCIGIIIVLVSALLVNAWQTGPSAATIGLAAALGLAVVLLIVVNVLERRS